MNTFLNEKCLGEINRLGFSYLLGLIQRRGVVLSHPSHFSFFDFSGTGVSVPHSGQLMPVFGVLATAITNPISTPKIPGINNTSEIIMSTPIPAMVKPVASPRVCPSLFFIGGLSTVIGSILFFLTTSFIIKSSYIRFPFVPFMDSILHLYGK